MARSRFFQRLKHLPRRLVREFLKYVQLLRLSLINLFTNSHVTHPGGPVVSMTTYGLRSNKVHLALESIAQGAVLPSQLILWIDEEALFKNLPTAVQRLQKRGLEVRFCRNYGAHNKYYPYVESQETFNSPLVTADDDLLYPRYWLKKLIEAHRAYPETVNCYAAHIIPLNEHGFERYTGWKRSNSTTPSFCQLGMGCVGIIYPPSFLMVLKRTGTAFETCCPKGDDLWLHVQALRSGFKIRQIVPRLPYFTFQIIPGTQQTALCHENVDGDGNERQMKATYKVSDFALLRADCDDPQTQLR